MQFLKKLKNILQYNRLFLIVLIISILYTLISICILKPKSKYSENFGDVYGYILDYKIDGNKLSITLKAKEKIIITYYFKSEEEKEHYKLSYGDYIYANGTFSIPKDNTNLNLFNYRKYLLSQKINYIIKADNIQLIKGNTNVFYKIKNIILKRIEKCSKSSSYLKTFIFADKNYIDNEIFSSYQSLGISHLLAVSGMHVSLISLLLLKLLDKFTENKRYILISILLLFYLFLTNYTISMVRATFQFILFFINKSLKLNIDSKNIVLLLFSILLIYNPFYIYNVGFIFSFAISFSLITLNKILNKGNIIYSLFMVSIVSFLISIPILINNFYQINFLSIIYNIFYVPFVSYILFPLNLLTLIFPILDNINYFFIMIFENFSNLLSNIKIFNVCVAKIPLWLVFIYYILLIILFKQFKNKKFSLIKTIKIIIIILIFIIIGK